MKFLAVLIAILPIVSSEEYFHLYIYDTSAASKDCSGTVLSAHIYSGTYAADQCSSSSSTSPTCFSSNSTATFCQTFEDTLFIGSLTYAQEVSYAQNQTIYIQTDTCIVPNNETGFGSGSGSIQYSCSGNNVTKTSFEDTECTNIGTPVLLSSDSETVFSCVYGGAGVDDNPTVIQRAAAAKNFEISGFSSVVTMLILSIVMMLF